MADTAYQSLDSHQAERWNRPREEAESIAAALPPLLVSAETAGVGRVARRARPPQGRNGRDLLAVPPLPASRIPRPSSTGASRQSRSTFMCASASGKPPRPSGSGGMDRSACAMPRHRNVPEKWERATVLALALGLASGSRRRAHRRAGREHAARRRDGSRCGAWRTSLPSCRLSDADLPPELVDQAPLRAGVAVGLPPAARRDRGPYEGARL